MRFIKNKQDKRFRDTEQKINRAFISFLYRGDHHVYIEELCTEAQIFVSTFYNHYPNTGVVLEIIEQNLQKEFLQSIANTNSTEAIIRRLLIFISKNQDYFLMSIQRHNYQWLSMILKILQPNLTANWYTRAQRLKDYRFLLLSGEIIATITDWGQQNCFDVKNVSIIQRRLQKLISTAEFRFRQLDKIK